MSKGKGRAGSHTTLTEAARPVVEALEKYGRVSRGVIQARVGARRHSIKVAALHISGLGYYSAWLDGQVVGDHELDPIWTRYDRRVHYVTHDISAALNNSNKNRDGGLGQQQSNSLCAL